MWTSGAKRDALPDGPDKPEQLAGDGGGRDHRALPARGEPAIGLVQDAAAAAKLRPRSCARRGQPDALDGLPPLSVLLRPLAVPAGGAFGRQVAPPNCFV